MRPTCSRCQSVDGVLEVNVNLASEKASLLVRSSVEVTSLVEKTGYHANFSGNRVRKDRTGKKLETSRRRMTIAWIFTSVIIVWMIREMFFGMAWPSMIAYRAGMIVLALPVLVWAGRTTYSSGFRAALRGNPNMDTLIMLGSGVSFFTGPAVVERDGKEASIPAEMLEVGDVMVVRPGGKQRRKKI